jgi:hypothetical protein
MMDEASGWFEGVSLVEAILRLSVAVTVREDVGRLTSDELEWHAAMAHALGTVMEVGVSDEKSVFERWDFSGARLFVAAFAHAVTLLRKEQCRVFLATPRE